MARLPRLYVAGQPQQVILRALADLTAFVDAEDHLFFVDCLRMAARDNRLAVHAYALSPRAVHLLGSPADEASLPKTIQAVGRRYVAYFNRRHRRTGALWEGRYRATVIEAERYLLSCMRLIDTQPGLAPGNAPAAAVQELAVRSSYPHHVGLVVDPVITDHRLYWALGNTPFERQRAYRELCEHPLDSGTAQALREATLKGWVLGGESFRAWCAAQANRRISPLPRGRPRKNRATDSPDVPNSAPATG